MSAAPDRLQTLPSTTRILIRKEARRGLVTALLISVRLARSLARHGIRRVGDVHGRTVAELLERRGIGRTQVWELLLALKRANALDPAVVFPPAPLLRRRGALPRHAPSWLLKIRIRPAARSIPFERCVLSNWLRGTLDVHHIRLLGDLNGRTFGSLRKLRRFGRLQARELFQLLASNDLLEPALPFSFKDTRAMRMAALEAMAPDAVRATLTADTPPFAVLRHLVVGVSKPERRTKLADLPLPGPLAAKVRARGYVLTGDLDGVSLGALTHGRWALARGELAFLRGMLRATGALVETGPTLDVPARWRKVRVVDVPMPNPLQNALLARGVRTLGDLARLTPERLGQGFGPVRDAALRALLRGLKR